MASGALGGAARGGLKGFVFIDPLLQPFKGAFGGGFEMDLEDFRVGFKGGRVLEEEVCRGLLWRRFWVVFFVLSLRFLG